MVKIVSGLRETILFVRRKIMRKKKTIKDIAGYDSIEVLELRLGDSNEMVNSFSEMKDGVSIKDIFTKTDKLIPLFTTIKEADVKNISYSELDEIEDAFREINKSFLTRLERLGIKLNLQKQADSILPQAKESSAA